MSLSVTNREEDEANLYPTKLSVSNKIFEENRSSAGKGELVLKKSSSTAVVQEGTVEEDRESERESLRNRNVISFVESDMAVEVALGSWGHLANLSLRTALCNNETRGTRTVVVSTFQHSGVLDALDKLYRLQSVSSEEYLLRSSLDTSCDSAILLRGQRRLMHCVGHAVGHQGHVQVAFALPPFPHVTSLLKPRRTNESDPLAQFDALKALPLSLTLQWLTEVAEMLAFVHAAGEHFEGNLSPSYLFPADDEALSLRVLCFKDKANTATTAELAFQERPQLKGKESDVYSLGMIAHALLTRQVPSSQPEKHKTDIEKFLKTEFELLFSAEELVIVRDTCAFATRCLSESVGDRPSALHAARTLRQLQEKAAQCVVTMSTREMVASALETRFNEQKSQYNKHQWDSVSHLRIVDEKQPHVSLGQFRSACGVLKRIETFEDELYNVKGAFAMCDDAQNVQWTIEVFDHEKGVFTSEIFLGQCSSESNRSLVLCGKSIEGDEDAFFRYLSSFGESKHDKAIVAAETLSLAALEEKLCGEDVIDNAADLAAIVHAMSADRSADNAEQFALWDECVRMVSCVVFRRSVEIRGVCALLRVCDLAVHLVRDGPDSLDFDAVRCVLDTLNRREVLICTLHSERLEFAMRAEDKRRELFKPIDTQRCADEMLSFHTISLGEVDVEVFVEAKQRLRSWFNQQEDVCFHLVPDTKSTWIGRFLSPSLHSLFSIEFGRKEIASRKHELKIVCNLLKGDANLFLSLFNSLRGVASSLVDADWTVPSVQSLSLSFRVAKLVNDVALLEDMLRGALSLALTVKERSLSSLQPLLGLLGRVSLSGLSPDVIESLSLVLVEDDAGIKMANKCLCELCVVDDLALGGLLLLRLLLSLCGQDDVLFAVTRSAVESVMVIVENTPSTRRDEHALAVQLLSELCCEYWTQCAGPLVDQWAEFEALRSLLDKDAFRTLCWQSGCVRRLEELQRACAQHVQQSVLKSEREKSMDVLGDWLRSPRDKRWAMWVENAEFVEILLRHDRELSLSVEEIKKIAHAWSERKSSESGAAEERVENLFKDRLQGFTICVVCSLQPAIRLFPCCNMPCFCEGCFEKYPNKKQCPMCREKPGECIKING